MAQGSVSAVLACIASEVLMLQFLPLLWLLMLLVLLDLLQYYLLVLLPLQLFVGIALAQRQWRSPRFLLMVWWTEKLLPKLQ